MKSPILVTLALVVAICAAMVICSVLFACKSLLKPVCPDGTLSCTNDEQLVHPHPWTNASKAGPDGGASDADGGKGD